MSTSITPDEIIKEIEEEIALNKKLYNESWTFHPTRKYTYTNIQVIDQLPEELNYPRRQKTVTVSKKGIRIEVFSFEWSEILLTGIKTRHEVYDYPIHIHYLVVVLKNGQKIEAELRPRFFDYSISKFESTVEIYKRHEANE